MLMLFSHHLLRIWFLLERLMFLLNVTVCCINCNHSLLLQRLILQILAPLISQERSILRTIGRGKNYDGLYLLEMPATVAVQPSVSVHAVMARASSALWHSRRRHPSHSRLHASKSVLPFVDSDVSHDHSCDICPLAKQKRLSFSSNNRLSATAFDLVHALGPLCYPFLF
ncbi:uncharacterized protein LOC111023463 [Momordica charantia]|uniref:Uncharacterized protein LOC111023463 n=1 Tax=Momordica charantia TaxID=3673 RepID=A0A6J1DR06_MOMCH|nr:uncharacterized protein LOC111023463 [Momordica charantia]XP_022156584.1 uncharacterized protein LOC111023463 [Momordica charantia]